MADEFAVAAGSVPRQGHGRTDAIYPEMRAQQGQVSAAAAEFIAGRRPG